MGRVAPSPPAVSCVVSVQASLDWLNFLLADVRGGLGPYVSVYLLTEAHWDPPR
jgi:hypothetical protein